MGYLIVNADDFGWTEGVNKGIIQAHKEGIVTSTTVMMNMPFAYESVEYSKLYPNLGFGVHLVLTDGKPLGKNYRTLTGKDGSFKTDFIKNPCFDPKEVQEEWVLQIEAFLRMGIRPTHFDSHMHVHRSKELENVVAFLQKTYNLPVRNIFKYRRKDIFKHAGFNKEFYNLNVTKDVIKKAIRNLKGDGVLELMCHPAYNCEKLNSKSPYNSKREEELQVLCDKELKHALEINKVQLINYGSIPDSFFPYFSFRDRVKSFFNR